MLKDTEIIEVTNKVTSTVVYAIPERNNLVRTFRARETKKVEMGELRQLSYDPGGYKILAHYLTIQNKEAVEELLGHVEPEYFYTTEEIITLLENGSMAQMEDFFNFASEGSIEQLKDLAVSTKLNDMRKRDLIKKKLGFNVTHAIELLEEDVQKVAPKESKTRQAAPINEKAEPKTPTRQAAPVTEATFATKKYNVVD